VTRQARRSETPNTSLTSADIHNLVLQRDHRIIPAIVADSW
jgi:hypothetical protein